MHESTLLKQILEVTRDLWDRPETRAAVRENFLKILACRTAALGYEVYASELGEKCFFHTCKSRSCPSCGYRATLLWQDEQKAILPEVPYAGIVFTMPRPLWRIFQLNRHLLRDLPALGAAVIQEWVTVHHGACPLILVMPHTFGGDLQFNTHLHILVSAGGLQESSGRWVEGIRFNKQALMRSWCAAVTTHLYRALKARVLKSDIHAEELERLLIEEGERPFWVIYIDRLVSKSHFAGYAGRYVRRLPIALRRLSKVAEQEVHFLAKDTKAKQSILTRYSVWDFVARLAEHVHERYNHGIRYFGLLAPRAKAVFWAGLFLVLNQDQRPRPKRLRWRSSLQKHFGVDPLIDSNGQAMKWIRRETASPARAGAGYAI